jgi:hypothetical protein
LLGAAIIQVATIPAITPAVIMAAVTGVAGIAAVVVFMALLRLDASLRPVSEGIRTGRTCIR